MGETRIKRAEPITIVKETDQIVNNSTTLVDVSDLKKALKPNTKYQILLRARTISPNTADIDIGFKAIPGTLYAEFVDILGVNPKDVTNFGTLRGYPSSGNIQTLNLIAFVETGPAGGTCQCQFTQQTQTVGDTKIMSGSILRIQELD